MKLENSQNIINYLESCGLEIPLMQFNIRPLAYLHSSGNIIMNAATMFYGGAKTGKTTTLINAFRGSKYIFLDFDRNYENVAKSVIDNEGLYFNGLAAYEVLYQLMDGKLTNIIVIIDALNSVIKSLCNRFLQFAKKEGRYNEANLLESAIDGIGINQQDTVTFFNLIIEPMTKSNSINFIHHTTQNFKGEKMEGNQGAWLSVFDFTYHINRETKVFYLESSRLTIAPSTIGSDNVYSRLEKIINNNIEKLLINGEIKKVCKVVNITDKCKPCRNIYKELKNDNKLKVLVIGKTHYIEVDSLPFIIRTN